MGEFFTEYGLFLAKAFTLFVIAGFLIVLFFSQLRGSLSTFTPGRTRDLGLHVERLNDEYEDLQLSMQRATQSRAAWKAIAKEARKRRKAEAKGKAPKKGAKIAEAKPRRRVFVLDFRGDIRATQVANLRREVSAILTLATDNDEVIVRLENAGGTVHEHGLAASQLLRLREASVPLTIAVDKVAASGGYMMAACANKIIAAPFAIVGSIGVLAQIPNFHRALEQRGIDFEQVTAGKYKRTLTMFGRNTEEGRAKLKEELEEVHTLFKSMISEHRPHLDIEAVATGEYWHGTRAKERGLVDEVSASDDYLIATLADADLYHVRYRGRQRLQERALQTVRAATEEILGAISASRYI